MDYKNSIYTSWSLAVLSLHLFVQSAHGAFSINLQFNNDLDAQYQSAFTEAATFWESIIIDYRVNSPLLNGININATLTAIDGPGGVLGSAGPTDVLGGNVLLNGDINPSHVLWATSGDMNFDIDDVDNLIVAGSFNNVIQHEMGHVIGLGTLWNLDIGDGNIYNNVLSPENQFQYVGVHALTAYQNEFDPDATFIPIEEGGGPGTAGGHWDEVDNGAGLTGITDPDGRDMAFGLMTGWLNAPTFVSETTIAQFEDLGYEVIPEPGSLIMILLATSGVVGIRRFFRV